MDTTQWGLHNLAQVISPVIGWGLLSVAGWGIIAPWIASLQWLKGLKVLVVLVTVLAALSGAALFTPWIASYTVNRIVSALAVGTGAVLIQRVVEK